MKEVLSRRISNYDQISWKEVFWADKLEKEEHKKVRGLFPNEARPHKFKEIVSLVYRVLFPEKTTPHWCKEKCSFRFDLRELVMNDIGDVAAYWSIPKISDNKKKAIYDDIHEAVHESIKKLHEDLDNANKPLIVIAH